jgi:hypothetical protein
MGAGENLLAKFRNGENPSKLVANIATRPMLR